ncbi:MAG: hypothetical protein WC142_09310 [Bacteroidales bacterium]|jgi:hypothetical protein
MKKIIVLFFLLIIKVNIYAQVKEYSYDHYNNMIDSQMVIFGQNIEIDLALEGLNIPKRTSYDIPIVGYNIILEVFFTPKLSCILTLYASSDAMIAKYFKQKDNFHIRKRSYFETFKHYIQENNKLPYHMIEYFRYQFITPYNDSPKDHAIYGEYKFGVSEEKGVEIIEKKIEILKSKDEIMLKYKSNF